VSVLCCIQLRVFVAFCSQVHYNCDAQDVMNSYVQSNLLVDVTTEQTSTVRGILTLLRECVSDSDLL